MAVQLKQEATHSVSPVTARKAATVIPEQSSYFAQQLDQRRTEVSTRLLLGQLKTADEQEL